MVRFSIATLLAAALAAVFILGAAAADPVAEQRQMLAPLMSKLSDADRSVLRYSVQSPKRQLMTTEGSANDELWSKLAEWGYLIEVPTAGETGRMAQSIAAMGVKMKLYSVTRDGQTKIPILMQESSKP